MEDQLTSPVVTSKLWFRMERKFMIASALGKEVPYLGLEGEARITSQAPTSQRTSVYTVHGKLLTKGPSEMSC